MKIKFKGRNPLLGRKMTVSWSLFNYYRRLQERVLDNFNHIKTFFIVFHFSKVTTYKMWKYFLRDIIYYILRVY